MGSDGLGVSYAGETTGIRPLFQLMLGGGDDTTGLWTEGATAENNT